MENIIEKRVLIAGEHPWSGEIGTVKAFENTKLGKTGYLVQLDNGTSCYVFNRNQLQILRR